jgi:glycosyltransferase involved in cell wall biosynthesis
MLIRGILRLLQTPADIYHALDLPALPACYVAAQLRRKPLIFESYELPLSLPLFELSTSRRWLYALLRPLLAIMIPRCDKVIAVSPPIVEEMCRRYHVTNVSLIRNVPPYQIVPESDRLRHFLGLNANIRIALYQGYLQPGRGLDIVIRAAAFLERDIVIVLMGKNIGTTQEQLEALIAAEGVADRVKIIPAVPYTELLNWTASADIGLTILPPDYSPNIQMILPNKFFEYLMAGIPVLTSQLDTIVEIVKSYDVGRVVHSLEPSEVGAAINAVLADAAALIRMRYNALHAARHTFCWEIESSELIQLYREIQSKNQRR